ncbi:MAG: hemolysin family protein [Rickettsiales bacterium]
MSSSRASADPEPESRSSLLTSLRNFLKTILGQKTDTSLREAVEEAIEEHEEQTDERLAPEEKVMLHKVLSFGDIEVDDIMVPRSDIEAVSVDITLPELKAHIIEHGHTRIPVYEETLDRMRGFVHVKDLLPMLASDEEYSLTRIMRPLLFIAPSMRITDLLFKMRSASSHMAIVVDEHGGTDGLVTMEDVLEELVGEIHDEHDDDEEEEDRITKAAAGKYDVSARIRIDALEASLGLQLVDEENDGDFETLGGFIFAQLGRVPTKGEMVSHDSGVRFEVMDADERRIHKVRIHAKS